MTLFLSRRAIILTCAGLSAFLCVQILAGNLVLSRWRTQNLSDAQESLQEIAAFTASGIARRIQQTDALLLALPEILAGQQLADAAIGASQRLLKAQVGQNLILRNIAILDAAGEVIVSASPTAPTFPLSRLEQTPTSAESGLAMSKPFRSETSGEWLLAIGRRIMIPDTAAAYGVAMISVQTFATTVTPPIQRRGVELALSIQGVTILRSPFLDSVVGQEASTAAEGDQASATLSAALDLPLAPMRLRVTTPVDTALAEWRRDAEWLSMLSIVIGLLEVIAAIGLVALANTRAQARVAAERATEELTASKRRAQEAADARGIFIANMNHELRTPLNAVIGFSEILADELFGPIGNQRYRDYAADIHASGTHLLALINDIIDFSTIDMGHRKLLIETINLATTINEALRLLKPQISARGVRVRISGVRSGDAILADTLGIRQVLLNVVSNAVKFSPAGGLIEIAHERPAGSTISTISVTDNGPGIADADIDRLGEQFFRTRAATESAVGGAGLGLSISMSLMKLMGGTISIKSRLGDGATLTVHVPAAESVGGSPRTTEEVFMKRKASQET